LNWHAKNELLVCTQDTPQRPLAFPVSLEMCLLCN
jgi:hypothetical protein